MKRTVRVLRRAQRDVQEIHDLVAREAPARSAAFLDALLDKLQSLEAFAERGASPRDPVLRARGYRFVRHGHYLIFFKVPKRQVRAHRVLHRHCAYRGLL